MLESYLTELKAVRAAIERLTADPTSSQSVSSANGGSFSASFMDIDKLYRREQQLCTLIAKFYRGGGLGMSYPIYTEGESC